MIVELRSAQEAVNYWKQERLILAAQTRVAGLSIKLYTNLHGSSASPLAVYTSDSVGVNIDMTDYARAYAGTLTHIYVEDADVPITYDVTLTIKGLINPSNVYIPAHVLESAGALIVPPSKIIYGTLANDPTRLELYAPTGTWATADQLDAKLTSDKRAVYQIKAGFTIVESNSHTQQSYTLTPMRCGVEYALVRWRSFTGERRISWFEVVKQKTENADNYSLEPQDNEFVEIKGRVDGFTLRMDGLSSYDLWYYADVINSSEVAISRGTEAYTRVQVTSKSITYPDGEAHNGKLEINVNWRRYDPVAM